MNNIFFNAHHSPLGAFASFTLGFPGMKGGLGLELGKPADQNILIGVESREPNVFQALPFYAGAEDGRLRFETGGITRVQTGITVNAFERSQIRRELKPATDTWSAGDMTFRIYSMCRELPDPEQAPEAELKHLLLPAVLAELTVDNTSGERTRRAFFGFQGSDPYTAMRRFNPNASGLIGVGQGRHTAIAALDPAARGNIAFTPEELVSQDARPDAHFDLGPIGGLVVRVPARQKKTFHFVVCFYHGGPVTAGLDAVYYYTRYYPNIESVAGHALRHFDQYRTWALEADAELDASGLSPEQKLMFACAVRSYTASTELLEDQGKPYWIVNEGEYRMINTMDLVVDHLFLEMKMHPWTVRNVLDRYAQRHSYRDQVRRPGDPRLHSGGVSFTHDQGLANTIAHEGYSVYERLGTDGCFSFMTHEQLTNWICCAAVYYRQTGDEAWLQARLGILIECLESLQHRDHPEPEQRNGVMGFDSSRTDGAAEITTFDCHDASLRQARNNLYLAVKDWAAYVMLDNIFRTHGLAGHADSAAVQAQRCAATVVKNKLPEGYIPAILPEGEAMNPAKIIPAIEGLVFPYIAGYQEAVSLEGPFAPLIHALKTHLETILVPGACLLEDGGWKLTSSHDNTWPSKIYLAQFVAREILGLAWDEKARAADRAHVAWLTNPETCYWGWSDQMVNGKAVGARYYPRGVTSVLWLTEGKNSR